jgi:hypothetical protein
MFGLPDDGKAPADHWLRWLTNSPSKDFHLALRSGDEKTLSMADLGLISLKARGSDNLGEPTTVFLERREVNRLPGDGVALVANEQVSPTHEAGCSDYLVALLAKYGDNIELCRTDSCCSVAAESLAQPMGLTVRLDAKPVPPLQADHWTRWLQPPIHTHTTMT